MTNATATVAHDLLCSQCGYSLRTLSSSAVCPECATPVATTLASEKRVVQACEPAKVRGVTFVLCGWTALLLGLAVFLLSDGIRGGVYRAPVVLVAWGALQWALVQIPAMLIIAGVLMATRRPRAGAPRPAGGFLRWVARWFVLLGWGPIVLVMLALQVGIPLIDGFASLQLARGVYAFIGQVQRFASVLLVAGPVVTGLGLAAFFRFSAGFPAETPWAAKCARVIAGAILLNFLAGGLVWANEELQLGLDRIFTAFFWIGDIAFVAIAGNAYWLSLALRLRSVARRTT